MTGSGVVVVTFLCWMKKTNWTVVGMSDRLKLQILNQILRGLSRILNDI